jgi:hypothetical protein
LETGVFKDRRIGVEIIPATQSTFSGRLERKKLMRNPVTFDRSFLA